MMLITASSAADWGPPPRSQLENRDESDEQCRQNLLVVEEGQGLFKQFNVGLLSFVRVLGQAKRMPRRVGSNERA